MKDADISGALGIRVSTVERVRRRGVEEGLESALARKQQWRCRPQRLDDEGEAHLLVPACGIPPQGHAH